MHALAGTIGHDIITDEEARQVAKQASRERAFAAALPDKVDLFFVALTGPATSGTSTPSTAASPPHDAEAAREVERLAATKLQFLAAVRSWADGDPGVFTVDEAAKAIDALSRVRKVLDGLEHQARQYRERDSRFTAAGIGIAVAELKDALR